MPDARFFLWLERDPRIADSIFVLCERDVICGRLQQTSNLQRGESVDDFSREFARGNRPGVAEAPLQLFKHVWPVARLFQDAHVVSEGYLNRLICYTGLPVSCG